MLLFISSRFGEDLKLCWRIPNRMGSVCSSKRDAHDDDNIIRRGFSSRRFKVGRSSCLESFLLGRGVDCPLGRNNCPSLMELCVHRIRKVIDLIFSLNMFH